MSLHVEAQSNIYVPVHISILNIEEHPWHYHNDTLEIIYVLKGEIDLSASIYTSHLTAGDISVINPRVIHYINSSDDNIVMVVDLDIEYFETHYIDFNYAIFICNSKFNGTQAEKHFKMLRKHLADMYYDYVNDSAESSESLISNSVLCLSVLMNHFREWQMNDNVIITSNPYKNRPVQLNRLTNIITYLYKNFQKKITLDDVAASEYISKYYVSRIISQGVGMSFQTYLNLIRVEFAQKHLYETNWSINTIAENCGFSSPGFFRKSYMHYTGLTPLTDRKRVEGHTVDVLPLQDTDVSGTLSIDYIYFLLGINKNKLSAQNQVNADMYIKSTRLDIVKTPPVSLNKRQFCAQLNSGFRLFSYDAIMAIQQLHRYNCCSTITVHWPALKNTFEQFGNWNFLSLLIETLTAAKIKMLILTESSLPESEDFLSRQLLSFAEKHSYTDLHFHQIQDEPSCNIYENNYSALHYIKTALSNSNELNILSLFPDDTAASSLFNAEGLKHTFFYAFYVLNRLGDEILEQTQDYVITRSGDMIKILIFNLSENDKESHKKNFVFKLTNLKRAYDCCIYNITAHSGNETAVAGNLNIAEPAVLELIERKAFPEFDIYGIENSPEYNLYTTVPAEAVTFIELI